MGKKGSTMLSASCFELRTHDYQFTLYVNRLICDHLENWVKKASALFYFIKKHIFKLDFKSWRYFHFSDQEESDGSLCEQRYLHVFPLHIYSSFRLRINYWKYFCVKTSTQLIFHLNERTFLHRQFWNRPVSCASSRSLSADRLLGKWWVI